MHVNWRCHLCMLRVTCNEIVVFPLYFNEHIRNYDSSSYIGIDPGREIIKKWRPRITRVPRNG